MFDPASSAYFDLSPEPDLHPLYPTPGCISPLLSPHSGLSPPQKAELVAHCLTRACVFGDFSVVSHLLGDALAQPYVDLGIRDEDGLGLISLAIHGFGAESERDVEREECVRLLIAQGADISADKAGWTPLHHAALLSPPTLISHLMTHGCSPFAVTRRNLTALDIVTAQSVLPGREDIALLLEESMRSEGWTGGRMEAKRRSIEERAKRKGRQKGLRDDVAKVLGVNSRWWGDGDDDHSDSSSDSDSEEDNDAIFTPPIDYSSMLVFSPPSLPRILESLITNFRPSLRDAQPANTLYLLARFAGITCDHTWLEDLIIAACDAIEETFFNQPEDVTCLVYWLYNTTLWLHLLQCDNSINEACELLGSFELIEEVINSIFVFVIRFAERKIDQLLDPAILDHSSQSSDLEPQFESEWSFLRSFTPKKKATNVNSANSSPLRNGAASAARPPSPSVEAPLPSSTSMRFSSLRQSFSRASSSAMPLQSMFQDTTPTPPPSPADLVSFLTALHKFLTLSEINPALITQLWSQVLYWTSCEIFNRILSRKKYLCRSRAMQIAMNVGALEEWVGLMGLPNGVQSHFAAVKDLLRWLQCLSSIKEFPDLIATIQELKHINPMQMRRAVRDYKYEVNEGKMTEECCQYLIQLQKDWEKHRIKLSIESLRKEIVTGREGSATSSMNDDQGHSSISTSSSSDLLLQNNIDLLFEKEARSTWEPPKPPKTLGELLDSRFMLPLLLPSDPRLLSALPEKLMSTNDERRRSNQTADEVRSPSRRSREALPWRSRNRKLREVNVDVLEWVDGVRSAARWARSVEFDDHDGDSDNDRPHEGDSQPGDSEEDPMNVKAAPLHATPLTRAFSGRRRSSQGGEAKTPID